MSRVTGKLLALLLVLSLLLAACSAPPPTGDVQTPVESPALPGSASPAFPATAAASPTRISAGLITLTVWVPPRFDPDKETPAGNLLAHRLEAFYQEHPDARVEVRVKADQGPAGLVESLTAASSAAPEALPDLVALPWPALEAAALKGLVRPSQGFSQALDNPDWYGYARQMASVQNSIFGLPFAGDALVLVYRPEQLAAAEPASATPAAGSTSAPPTSPPPESPPATWQAVIDGALPLAFPAGDPQALFTFAFYRAAGGPDRDSQGRPTLSRDPLSRVFRFYQEAGASGAMPYWLAQYQDDSQSWQGFLDGNVDMAATWASRYLTIPITGTAIAPLPSADGKPYTLAYGWVWALVGAQPARQEKAVLLAQYLTESDFLAAWSQAAGLLPSRPSALRRWSPGVTVTTLDAISASARLYPSADVLSSAGPPLQQATLDLLKGEVDADTAARNAVDALAAP